MDNASPFGVRKTFGGNASIALVFLSDFFSDFILWTIERIKKREATIEAATKETPNLCWFPIIFDWSAYEFLGASAIDKNC